MLNVELEYKQVIAPMGTRLLFSLQVCATFLHVFLTMTIQSSHDPSRSQGRLSIVGIFQ